MLQDPKGQPLARQLSQGFLAFAHKGQALLRKIRSVQLAEIPQACEEVRRLAEGEVSPSLQPRPRPKCQARESGLLLYIPRPSRVLRYPFSRVLNRRTRNAPAYPAHPPKVFQVRIAFAYKSCDISGFSR